MSKTIIAGPCSVESQAQLREVTLALKAIPEVTMIRAGVWKPRTRPGAFEGLGEPALGWMRDLANELGVRYCCEVARPEHVELCLAYGIDTLWLGARTTTNPFMVDELCQALRGSGAHMLVKNPVCPDVRLWLGAIERLQQAGISHLTAVHRGFAMYHNRGYRNAPLWEVALELRHELPAVPILCDPSHIGGRRDLVAPPALEARQLDYDGLLIEGHPPPQAAWDDAAPPVTPAASAPSAMASFPIKNSVWVCMHLPLSCIRSDLSTLTPAGAFSQHVHTLEAWDAFARWMRTPSTKLDAVALPSAGTPRRKEDP